MQAHVGKDTCVVRKTHSAWDSALYACRDVLLYDACIVQDANTCLNGDHTHVERRRGHVLALGGVRCLYDEDAR